MTRTCRRVLGLCTFSLLAVIRGCSQSDFGGSDSLQQLVIRPAPTPCDTSKLLGQQSCADRVVSGLVRRDGLEPYILIQEVYLEPNQRIRVFFGFRQDMRGALRRLDRFVKYPTWLGGGRYASTYGRGQPGFEIHLDEDDSAYTVRLDAHKSSDVDEHEPAGDVASIVMHGINLLQHAAGQPEIAPCELLKHFESEWQNVPRTIALERPAEMMFYTDEQVSIGPGTFPKVTTEEALQLAAGHRVERQTD